VLLDTDALLQDVVPSPDGTRLALQEGGANDTIWVYDIARKTTTRLSFRAGDVRPPAWTPDGAHVTFATTQPFGLASMAADGSGREESIFSSDKEVLNCVWSPSGQLLVYSDMDPQTGTDLWVWSANDGKRRPFLQTRFNEGKPAFSPDGRWLAYESNESGRDEIYVRPFPGKGGKWQVSTDGGIAPLWSRDGREIFYRRDSAVFAVRVSEVGALSAGVPQLLFDGPFVTAAGAQHQYAQMPDGKRFVMVERLQPGMPQHVNLVLNWFGELQKRMTAQK
jgi:Tol biopolymer transport system component